ncbi:diacylglycerol kinase, partial [Streptomyces sp. NPDC056121]
MGRMGAQGPEQSGAARLLARLAVLAATGSVAVLVLALGEGGLVIVGSGLLGLVACAAGVWWFVAHRGAVRLLGALLAVLAPVAVLVVFAHDRLWLTALGLYLCWAAAAAFARAALRRSRPERPWRASAVPPPNRPVL